ncbi:MAG: tetratricopeptide repeat protein [Elusimicrobia bacterium]|nr:tetratricopeptide repeat protein [Elusimicrobiota bacterium]
MTDRFDWLEVERKQARGPSGPLEAFDAKSYLQQAERSYRRGAYEAALKVYGQALGEDAQLWEGWVGQVLCLVELGELAEARTWANKGLERFPQRPELQAAKALILAGQKEPAEAMELVDAAIGKKSPAPLVWLLRGQVLLRVEPGRGGEARCFEKAFEAGDPGGTLALRAGISYLDAGEPAKAKDLLLAATEKDGENPLAWYALGRAFESLFVFGRAASCYERAMRLKPEFKTKVVEALAAIHGRSWWRRCLGLFNAWTRGQ